MNFPLWLCQVLGIGEIFCCIMRCKAWARMQMKPCIRMPDNKSPRSWQLLIFPLSALLSSPRSGNPHSTLALSQDQGKIKYITLFGQDHQTILFSCKGSPEIESSSFNEGMDFYSTSRRIQQPGNTILSFYACSYFRLSVDQLSIPGLGAKTAGRRKQALPYNTSRQLVRERGYVLVSPHENNMKPGRGEEGSERRGEEGSERRRSGSSS